VVIDLLEPVAAPARGLEITLPVLLDAFEPAKIAEVETRNRICGAG